MLQMKKISLFLYCRISEDWVSEHIEGNPRDISFHGSEGLTSLKLGVSGSCVVEWLPRPLSVLLSIFPG